MATVATPAVASPVTASSNRAFPLRILVDSDVVGAIIGRSGSTIRSITEQTKARIDVHRDDNPDQKEKVITISGSSENCSEACYQILQICHSEYNSHKLYQEDIPDPRDVLLRPRSGPDIDTLHILAPSNLIGRLIGRGGASIKKMMEQTSTKIKISVNSITESTGEHTITVVGSLDGLRQAEKLISFKLRAAYLADMNLSLQAFNQQPYLFNNVPMPYVTPGSYATHQSPILATMVNHQARHGANALSRTVAMNHTHHQGQIPSQMYPGTPAYLPLYPNMNVPHSAASGLVGFNSIMPRFEQERETVYIYIPSTMVGAIIGKSGNAIKEMISASGATIKVATSPLTKNAAAPSVTGLVDDSAEKDGSKQSEQNAPEQATESRLDSTEDDTSETPEDAQAQLTNRKNSVLRSKSTNPSDNSTTRRVTVLGYPASQYTAQYLIYRKVSIESGKSDVSLMVEIHVPSQLVGKIIGKGGASVKNLQKKTRTTIRLPEEKSSQQTIDNGEPSSSNSAGNAETTVQITGEFEGSLAAQQHIRSLISPSSIL